MSDRDRLSDLPTIDAWSKRSGDYARTGCHADFSLEREQLLPAVRVLNEGGFFLEDIAGVDVAEGIMLVYHFDRYDPSQRVVLRLIVPHENKQAPSVSSIASGADWHERECYDFFGVVFENHPGLKPLLLPDDLGIHPLLKTRDRRSIYSLLPLDRIVGDRQ